MIRTNRIAYIFRQSTVDYHKLDDVDAPHVNPYREGSYEHILYEKNWIDAVQWHLEDIIRNPYIDPVEALAVKRRIDRSNQERTDMVESIDTYYRSQYAGIEPLPDATINTESPAWAIDRLSILVLKIYHMEEQVGRTDAAPSHIAACFGRLDILRQQLEDLTSAIDVLIADIAAGRKYMKVYRQMKMYNDPDTNPVLYRSKTRYDEKR
ncbi:MAG: DUF4254 domain-containing protein [Clostridiales bacterium]|nr:DUF4254 domain-containing protein [Clostridiales bacterium]